jgi:hypothetical protein
MYLTSVYSCAAESGAVRRCSGEFTSPNGGLKPPLHQTAPLPDSGWPRISRGATPAWIVQIMMLQNRVTFIFCAGHAGRRKIGEWGVPPQQAVTPFCTPFIAPTVPRERP